MTGHKSWYSGRQQNHRMYPTIHFMTARSPIRQSPLSVNSVKHRSVLFFWPLGSLNRIRRTSHQKNILTSTKKYRLRQINTCPSERLLWPVTNRASCAAIPTNPIKALFLKQCSVVLDRRILHASATLTLKSVEFSMSWTGWVCPTTPSSAYTEITAIIWANKGYGARQRILNSTRVCP